MEESSLLILKLQSLLAELGSHLTRIVLLDVDVSRVYVQLELPIFLVHILLELLEDHLGTMKHQVDEVLGGFMLLGATVFEKRVIEKIYPTQSHGRVWADQLPE